MPMNPWPPGISDAFTADAFTEDPQDITIRTAMDTGPAKVRRRFVNPTKKYTCQIVLRNATEYQTLTAFYYITCKGGTDTIALDHPITGVPGEFRFASPIKYSANGIAWNASFDLEMLP